ncbi:virulence RhuM family protein [Labilibaculum euxinus]|uniref:Cell filamentation protein Fic n=1 Tax=Labilibaculum euxinus TaxID=2686357 RepID=A0A7M4D596_9BACT|nr:virulence RhuM family protein [Labilibaculum euxinus]MUP37825.1 cell filamentation protein Fic [Labilibaculum euxinus]MVB07030.1 cell filamentation protein Fic [Labilibaculum euxinus]
MDKKKKLQIRNSTAEFLIFSNQKGQDGIEVRFENETIWLSQKLMAVLFDCSSDNISLHLKNIFRSGELDKNSVAEEFSVTASDGKNYKTKHYNLDAIISVGYRVNSKRATQFRQWATYVLKNYAIKGWVLDKERLKNGAYLNENYFDELLADIREIRASERKFYQKITDIYSTAFDYNIDSPTTKDFFATIQNKLHFAIHRNTAAELIKKRADSGKDYMGLTSWKNAPDGKIIKTDVSIAKNYLNKDEIKSLDRFVTMYLDYAETQAERNTPMSMEDWSDKLNAFLQFNEKEILTNSGKISHAIAKAFAESEFEKYRMVQDRLFQSDFDKLIDNLNKKEE